MTLSALFDKAKAALEQANLIDEYFSRCYTWDYDMLTKYSQDRREKLTKERGFGPLTHTTDLDQVRYRWIAVFPVTGGNEGHYIHVDLMWEREYHEGRIPLFLGKTFGGMEQAIKIANRLIEVLEV